MKIHVTADDIANGDRWSASNSPVARAVKRTLRRNKDYRTVKVRRSYFTVGRVDQHYQYPLMFQLPYLAAVAEQEFDHTGKMKPFEFEVK